MRRGRWLPICVVLVLLVVGVASGQTVNPPEAGAGLLRDLQIELVDLSTRVRALREASQTSTVPLDAVKVALERIRAVDLLIGERNRQLEERLRNDGASAQVQQRHRENARLVREGLDRVYAAAAPLAEPGNDIASNATATRSLLDALAAALASLSADNDRTPRSVTLPHRSMALPQMAPTAGASITPAYLDPNAAQPTAPDGAETAEASFTALIRARAAALGRDPIALFEFVQNEIDTDFYYGSMKGAEETLRQTSGNDTDQASLLIALLRASGISARYIRGVVVLTAAEAMAWTGVGSSRRAAEIFTRAGIPYRPIVQGGSIASFEIEHTWVEAYVSYSNYRGAPLGSTGQAWIALDPSFKKIDVSLGADVLAAMGFTADALIADYLSSSQANSPAEFYQTRISDYLANNRPDLTLEQALATVTIHPVRSGLLPNTLPYNVLAVHEELAAISDDLKHRVRFTADGEGGVSFDITIPAARLAGQRVTLSYVPAAVEDQDVANAFLGLDNTPAYLVKLRPVLKVGGVVEAAGATPIQMGALHSFTVEIQSPRETVPLVNSIVAGGYYAIGLGAGNSRYETPQVRAPADTEHPAADRLYSLAATYHQQWHDAEELLGRILRVVTVRPTLSHVMVGNAYTRTLLFGQPQAIDWRGVFVDADLHVSEPVPMGGENARAPEFMRLSGLAGSMLEGEVLQQHLQVDAVSAARLIQLAREDGIPVDDVDATNIATVLPQIQTAQIVKTEIADAVNQGWRVTIPRRDLTRHAWSGIGYIVIDPASGSGGYFISGGFAGGETTQTPADWAAEVAAELGTPYQDRPNSEPTAAHSIVKVRVTDGQEGTAGKLLPQPIAVWVRDAEGRPVENAVVTFRIVRGGGRFDPAGGDTVMATSNRTGIAEAKVELGKRTGDAPFYVKAERSDLHDTLVGENLVTVSVRASGGEIPLDAPFQLFGFPGAPAQLVKVLSPEGLFAVGTAAGTLRARVVDGNENPISNLPLNFEVLPAVARQGPLPASATNLKLYLREACLIPVPILGDCDGRNQRWVSTSLWGAQVETILGNTVDTTFRVRVSTEDLSPEPGDQRLTTEFELVSAGRRNYDAPSYLTPTLTATLLDLVNDRGELLNAAKVGTELPRPLEVVVVVLEDDYRVEPTGEPCRPTPDPPCFRIVALQTTRVRPIDIAVPGEVTFAGPFGTMIAASKEEESVRITFAVPIGGGATSPPIAELPEHGLGGGRYQSRIRVGPEPALNRILIDPTADVWFPAFDLQSTTPVVPLKARLRPGQRVTGADPSASPPVVAVGPADFYPTNLQHDVFGVRARILNAEQVLLGETGGAIADVDVEYVIEPAEYDADLAEVDVFEGMPSSGTWRAFLPGTSTQDKGHGRIHRGAGGFGEGRPFDATKDYSVRLLLNRGGGAQIEGDPRPLNVYLAGPLGADFRARENTARESRRKATIPLENGLREEQKKLATLIKKGLNDGASCGVPIQQIAILEQGSGACFWSTRFNFGDRDATPAQNPDPVAACSGFQPGISDHDYEVLVPRSFHTGPGGPAACVVDALNHAAEDPELNLGSVSFFRVSIEELFEGKLNIDPPPSGGSDAVGDVGLGRQTLLFKWALEGEWVTELVTKIAGDMIPGLLAPEVTVGGERVPLLDYVIDTLRTTPTIAGEATGIPKLEGFEWGVLQHFNFYKAGAHVGLTGKSVDPKSHPYALRQEAIHNAAKAGIRAATGRLLANEVGNPRFLETSRALYRSVGGCVTGAEDPSDPPPPAELFPKPCDSFEEYIASTAILDFRAGTLDRLPIFTTDELLKIYQFYRIKEDVECATAGCQTEITNEEDANRFVKGALEFIRDSVLSNPAVLSAYKTGLGQAGSDAAKRESNRTRADAGRAEAEQTVSYVLDARVFNDNALELQSIPLNMYPQPPPAIGYVVPRIVGRSSPPTSVIHDPRWTDTIVDVRRDFNGDPIPNPEDGKPQPVFEWEIDATGQHPAWFVLDPFNTVKECNKTDNKAGFIAYRIDMNNPGSIPDLAGVPGPPVTDPAVPAECVSKVPSLQVTKLVNNQAEITVAARTPVTVRNVITNTGAVPLQGVQVVDLLQNRAYPPFPLAPGQSMAFEGEFRSTEVGKQFVGPTEVLAFVADTIIPGGKTVSAWDSVRVNVVNPSCSIAIAPPTPDPNPYDSDGRGKSTVMQGGDVYRYYMAYGAAPESLVELMVNDEAVGARVDDKGNVAHYEPHPERPDEMVLVPGLEIKHFATPDPGTYQVRFVSVGGSRSVCSEPFDVVVTPREFTRVFSAGASIDAAGTIGIGLAGKAGAGMDIKITEQPGPIRTKLAIGRSFNAKLGLAAGLSSPKAKVVLPGLRAQLGASVQGTVSGLVMAGDTYEFQYQPNSTTLAQPEAAALGALILGQVAAGTVPLVGKVLEALINRVGNLDRYRVLDTVSLGLDGSVTGQAGGNAGLGTFKKEDNSSLGTLSYGLGAEGTVQGSGSALVSVDSKLLAEELIPGFKLSLSVGFDLTGGIGDLSETDETLNEDTDEKVLELEKVLTAGLKGSFARTAGAKLTLDTANDFKATKLTFTAITEKEFGWSVSGNVYSIESDGSGGQETFTFTFTDEEVLRKVVDQLDSINQLTAIGIGAGLSLGAGPILGPALLVLELQRLKAIVANHDGSYEAKTDVGHPTEIPVEIDLGAGARLKVAANIKFDRAINFTSEKGAIRQGHPYALEKYTDDDLIPDLQDVGEIADLFSVSFSGLRAEVGPVIDVVQQGVVALLNVVQSRNTAQLTFDGATAPFPQVGIASFPFEPLPGPVAPALQLPADTVGPANTPHYGIGGFHQFLPENQLLTAPGTLKIFYDDTEVASFDEKTLAIYEWNEAVGDWDHLGGTVDPVANTITTSVRRMALYTAAPPMPASRFTFSSQSTDAGTPDAPRTTITATSDTIRLNTGVVVPDGTLFTVRTLTPQGTDIVPFGTVVTVDEDPLLDGVQVRSQGGVVRFTADVPGSIGGVRALVNAVRGTALADQIISY